MLARPSNNRAEDLAVMKAASASRVNPWRGRLLMLVLNCFPAVHVLLVLAALFLPHLGWPTRIALTVGALYLMPPIVARLILYWLPIPEGRVAVGTKAFFGWWALFQLQVGFCRMPALEEALRLIPGLYSQWLRLWGARIGRFTYWSAGTLISDRSFLAVGDDVVLGAGVRLNSHVLAKGEDGQLELVLATVKIGDRAMVGGYSLLTAGTEISSDEVTRAFLISPPYSVWKNGKRVRDVQDSSDE